MKEDGPSDMAWRNREKRPREEEKEESIDEANRPRIPRFTSVILEAVRMDAIQKLFSSLEPLLRRVVSEELERALTQLVQSRVLAASPPRQIAGLEEKDLRLYFTNKPVSSIFSGSRMEANNGSPITIVLKDARTRMGVTECPEASARLDVVIVDGDFANDDSSIWTQEEFENMIIKERDGKRPLLTGDTSVTLNNGVGALGEIQVTDNSSWVKCRKFRLGVRLSSGCCDGLRIREALSEAFVVKDHRGELYKKHYPPHLNDEVWRLEKIRRDGAFHKKLMTENIKTVEDLLRLYVMDTQKLKNILGTGMSSKMWEATIEHAKSCRPNDKLYAYDHGGYTAIFNNIYEFLGVVAGGNYIPAESVTNMELIDQLIKIAYDNWDNKREYCGNASLPENPGVTLETSFQQGQGHSDARILPISSLNCDTMPDLQMQDMSCYQNDVAMHRDIPSTSTMGGLNPLIHVPGPQGDGLSVGISEVPTCGVQTQIAEIPCLVGTDRGYTSEEDIRAWSMQMLADNEFQEQLWTVLFESTGNPFPFPPHPHHYVSSNDHMHGIDGYRMDSNPMEWGPHFEGRIQSSGRANTGWLKLKAALRWGIFIKKIATKKRTQVEECKD